jgi:hypothetical protein
MSFQDGEETVEARFVEPSSLPSPMRAASAEAITLFQRFVATDRCQLA